MSFTMYLTLMLVKCDCWQTVTMVTTHLLRQMSLSAVVRQLTYFALNLTYILPTTMTSWAVVMTYKLTRVKTSTTQTNIELVSLFYL